MLFFRFCFCAFERSIETKRFYIKLRVIFCYSLSIKVIYYIIVAIELRMVFNQSLEFFFFLKDNEKNRSNYIYHAMWIVNFICCMVQAEYLRNRKWQLTTNLEKHRKYLQLSLCFTVNENEANPMINQTKIF